MIILFGKPGAGKGSQAKRLVKHGGYVLLGAGELLRQAAKEKPELLEQINAGKLVDSNLVFEMLELELERNRHEKIILDGFPRDKQQAAWLIKHLYRNPPEKIDIIVLDIPDSEVYRRLALRARQDDNPAAIAARLKIYEDSVVRAIDLLGEAAKTTIVDGVGTKDAVYHRLIKAIGHV
jgi:adenylate kinase